MRFKLPVPTSCAEPVACGVCCHGQEALPVGYWLSGLGDADRRVLPGWLRAELVALMFHFDQHGWPADGQDCVWFDAEARRCRHHQYRPEVCEEFKMGGESCRGVREMHRGELVARTREALRKQN